MRSKKIILVFIRHYLPGFKSGGPVRSVSNLIAKMGQDFDFRVVCLNRDHGDLERYTKIDNHKWVVVGLSKVLYIENLSFSLILNLIRELNPDMLYFNSFFDFEFSIKPYFLNLLLKKTPCLLSPRGEFSKNALLIKKLKKRVYLLFSRLTGLYRSAFWHATSAHERERIIDVMGSKNEKVLIANNLPSVIRLFYEERTKLSGELRIVMLARISRMKNITYSIDVLSDITKGDITLDIWGEYEDAKYWEECKRKIDMLPSNVKVTYCGKLPHEKLMEYLPSYDVSLLPTLGENFGHSIIESLMAGVPVVISNNTPWKNLNQLGIGFDIDLADKNKYVFALKSYLIMNDSEISLIRAKCKEFFSEWSNRNDHHNEYKKMFNAVINGY